ncbi:hypothetical protein TEA_018034 [Camellia sinensis var. sinensis]|uniref:Uncharacterized protein n=1 Tax=Camellia sinensis var. sinensis TaxID=542762 RepID=A0A4S4DMV5_CAMSN|nr:hypothetical protein TEA_018034 [Camellia sinensis var. sinensis]
MHDNNRFNCHSTWNPLPLFPLAPFLALHHGLSFLFFFSFFASIPQFSFPSSPLYCIPIVTSQRVTEISSLDFPKEEIFREVLGWADGPNPADEWVSRGKIVKAHPVFGAGKKAKDPIFGLAMGGGSQTSDDNFRSPYHAEIEDGIFPGFTD